MALFYPNALSINRFQGGYRAASDYTDLSDTETNDSHNVEYGPSGDITTRPGSVRLLNTSLKSNGGSEGRPITGHYYFIKTGISQTLHVVAAGDSLHNYTSSTSTIIRSGLNDNSETYWQFTQIQDPRSASDEIVLATNGVNPIQLWNGSATAINLSSLTSATQVPIAKYIINHKNRIYAANITDSTDSDASVKVFVSGFGTDGAADPHRFRDSFFVGGSGKQGSITAIKILNDQVIIYTKNSIWKFSPGAGNNLDTSSLQQIQETIGVLAPFTLVDIGGAHIFLSQNGVYLFNGLNLRHISLKVDDDLLLNSNTSKLALSKATFDKTNNRYVLYYPESGSNRNNRALIYDVRLDIWDPPVTGRRVNYISTFETSDRIDSIIYGDYHGYLYQDRQGTGDGISTGVNGVSTSATFNTLTCSSTSAPFITTGDGLRGCVLRIISGTGLGQEKIISTNTSQVLTIEDTWQTLPSTDSRFTVAAIPAYFQTKDYNFGVYDITKLFREVRVRVKEQGNINLVLTYIIDFKSINQAASSLVNLLDDGFAWGVGVWGQVRWGGRQTIRRKVSLRSISTQSLLGEHIALRFEVKRANAAYTLRGFDLTLKQVGKR